MKKFSHILRLFSHFQRPKLSFFSKHVKYFRIISQIFSPLGRQFLLKKIGLFTYPSF
jgi:hypothetical protein